ncbi:MAG: MAPEG family protein [Myxococcota bacterium]|jgi:uncharacterized MAPEG superfamily protein|nr:hypothetical protein [Deltaproteobacteria bacterium]MCP4241637.1 MAPEG family protein [bacterium]MDP6075422.1 MAPEG family protein [Myxococcota bacterium]MBT39653.1 hypothetical protein [Deltaproteobacteria bacterium]MDP7075636.1 MAPEG family protein [Myxococcota bacterium]
MSILLFCLFIGALLPIVLSWVGGYFRVQQFGSMDNKHPRVQSAQLEGAGARAVAAQQNAWEALAFFTAAVLVHTARGGSGETASILAAVWVAARILHGVCYLANLDVLRSLAFLAATGCAIGIFFF